MFTDVLLFLVLLSLVLIAFGLFSVGSKLSDIVHLLIESNKSVKKIDKCEEKLEIIMLKTMNDK